MTAAVETPQMSLSGRGPFERILMYVFVFGPTTAMAAAIPIAWIFGFFNWTDAVLLVVGYFITTHGIGGGFHRMVTHMSFRAKRLLKIALLVAGSLAVEGPVLVWVADHRRHHLNSDKEGDPHSPWRFGDDWKALAKGLGWAHAGWFLSHNANRGVVAKNARPELKDPDMVWISGHFWLFALISFGAPPLIGGLIGWSWMAALSAFFWGSLVRMALMHHVTWSINSICHTFGDQPLDSGDQSRNVGWLAVMSFGESWHNVHHGDLLLYRHGLKLVHVPGVGWVVRKRIDLNAWLIELYERLGWLVDDSLHKPDPEKLARKLKLSPVRA